MEAAKCSQIYLNLDSHYCALLRVVSNSKNFDHVTPIQKDLRWIPVKSHLYYRDALLVFKCVNNCAPDYLSPQF